MILLKLIIYILILTYPTLLFAQEEQTPSVEITVDEEILDTVFSIDSIKNYSFEKKKKLFDSIQEQIKNAYSSTPVNLSLIKSLADKQQRLFPDERKSYIDLAAYFDKTHDDEKVYENSKTALKKDNIIYNDPENRLIASAYTYIGRYYLETQKYQQAYEALSKALFEQTSLVAPFYYMGNACFHLNNYRECQNNYTYAFTRDIKLAYPVDYFFFGIALHKNGFTDKARQILEIGCEQYPNEQGLRLNLGYIYREQDKLIEAYLEFYAEQLLFGPESQFFQTAEINKNTTEKLIALRKDSREINTLKNIIDWEINFNKNEHENALSDIQNAKQNFESYNFTLSFLEYLTYFYMGDYENALKTIKHIQEKTYNLAIAYVSEYEIYSKFGNSQKADESFKKVLKLDPDNWKALQILGSSKNQPGKPKNTEQ